MKPIYSEVWITWKSGVKAYHSLARKTWINDIIHSNEYIKITIKPLKNGIDNNGTRNNRINNNHNNHSTT